MQAIGFTGLIRESIGLSQMLSMSCWHLDRLRENRESTEYTKYSSVALRSLQQRLVDPTMSTSDDVIIAVMAFATYAVSISAMRNCNGAHSPFIVSKPRCPAAEHTHGRAGKYPQA
jgi:hypothetical protein